MPLESIDDHRVRLRPTAKLIDFIAREVKSSAKDLPESIAALKSSHKNKRSECLLTLSDVRWLRSYLAGRRGVYMHELLDGVDLKLPEPRITPRNPELEARIKRLRAQQEARDYQSMTKSVDSVRKHMPEDTIAYQMKVMNKQLIAVAQFIFSVIAGFAFGFIGLELIVGSLDFGFRLLLGIMCALIVALAEIYFLAKKLSEDYDETPMGALPKKLHQE